MLEPAPVPVSAEYQVSKESLIIEFDQGLQANPILDVNNWQFCDGSEIRSAAFAAAAGNQVTINPTPFFGGPCAAGAVTYSPPPYDLVGENGVRVEAFADFPVSIV